MTRIKRQVRKRDGSLEPVCYDKITERLNILCNMDPPLYHAIDPQDITIAIVDSITNYITTDEIDNYAANYCASKMDHPDYLTLAARLAISASHKNLIINGNKDLTFSNCVQQLYQNIGQNG